MSRDEWDVFGSDTEDEDDNNGFMPQQQPEKDDGINLDPNFISSLENLVGLSVLQITQHFIKSSRSINLNQRIFGMAGISLPKLTEDTSFMDDVNQLISQMWSRLFSNGLSQRGVDILNLPFSEDHNDCGKESPGSGISYSCDGIALFRSFQFNRDAKTFDNIGCQDFLRTMNFQSSQSYNQQYLHHESRLRNLLVPGGFVMVFMSIFCASKDGEKWSASQLLSQWKYSSGIPVFTEAVWNLEHATIICSSSPSPPYSIHGNKMAESVRLYSILLCKRRCTINTTSCPWKGKGNRRVPTFFQKKDENNLGTNETWTQYERRVLEDATISRTIAERQQPSLCHLQRSVPVLTNENIDKAVQSIRTNGFVVVPGLFDKEYIQTWSDAVLSDFKSACLELQRKHNIDITNPGKEGQSDPLSYREMAMREDLRVDLRDGPNMQLMRKCENKNEAEVLNKLGYMCLKEGNETSPSVIETMDSDNRNLGSLKDKKLLQQSLRFHPSVLKIVEALCNPHETLHAIDNANPPLYRGNFGRWNFQGSGPNGKPQPIRVGQVGAVVSLPGAADQAIHADTSHLFEIHDCLPCHYVNMFTMGCASNVDCKGNVDMDGNSTGDNLVGGTAFVHGSHRLSVAASLTAEYSTSENDVCASAAKKNAQDEMYFRVIRPSLQPGDVLMFDCRTLHFGLANQSESGLRRPMLYVNMTHSWFNDPKNWDDRKSIFD